MDVERINLAFLVLLIPPLVAASPWYPHALDTREVCDGTSTTIICSDNCRNIVRCPENIIVDACLISYPYCHDPVVGDPICSLAPRCKGGPLLCPESGIFPDPYFCTIYHDCFGNLYSSVTDCVDSAFNIATGQCDLPLDAPVCDGPVPECLTETQFGALPDNRQYFYRCGLESITDLLLPFLRKCPDGQVFDENAGPTGNCV